MANYAHVIDGIVQNVIITDTVEEARSILIGGEVVESTNINPAFIGGQYRTDVNLFCYPDTDIPTVTAELMSDHMNEGHEISPIIDQYMDTYTQVYTE